MSITLVQSNAFLSSVTTSGGIGFNISLGSNTTLGNLLVFMIGANCLTTALTSSMGSGGWTQAGTDYQGSGDQLCALYYKANAAVINSGTNQTGDVLWSGTATVLYGGIFAEFSGVATVSPFDVASAGANAATGVPSCGSITPAGSGELIVCLAEYLSATPQTAGAGYTLISSSNTTGQGLAGQYGSSSSGAQTPLFGGNTGVVYAARAWAFLAAASTVPNSLALTGWGT